MEVIHSLCRPYLPEMCSCAETGNGGAGPALSRKSDVLNRGRVESVCVE